MTKVHGSQNQPAMALTQPGMVWKSPTTTLRVGQESHPRFSASIFESDPCPAQVGGASKDGRGIALPAVRRGERQMGGGRGKLIRGCIGLMQFMQPVRRGQMNEFSLRLRPCEAAGRHSGMPAANSILPPWIIFLGPGR